MYKDLTSDIDAANHVWGVRGSKACCIVWDIHCGVRRVCFQPCSHIYMQVSTSRQIITLLILKLTYLLSPVSDYWTLSLTPQKCINERTHLLIGGIINTMTDFLVFFLPIPTVLSLKMHRRQQVFVSALFSAGLVVCVAGTVRIYYAWKTTSTFDRTWVSYPLWIASMLELDIGIVSTSSWRLIQSPL